MTNDEPIMTNAQWCRPFARSISFAALVLASFVIGHSSFAETSVLDQSRRAIAENIPQVAIFKLNGALANGAFPGDQRAIAQRLLAEAQLAAGQPDEALKTIALISDLTDSAAALLRAHAFAGAGRWSEALPIYQSLSKQPGAPSGATFGEAESLQALGRTAEAATALERLTTTPARLRLASLRVELGQPKHARKLLDATPAGSPGDEKWRAYIEARILLLEKKPQAALAALEELQKSAEGQRSEGFSENLLTAATLAEAEVRLALSGTDAAEKSLETFIRKNPESAQLELIFRRLDQIYAEDKTPTEGALHSINRELPPRAAALARFYLARLQLREKRYERAASSLHLFLNQYPGHTLTPDVHAMEAELALATATAADTRRALADAESALLAASRTARDDEQRAEFALRTALVNLQQGEFVSAATHLETAKRSPRLRQSAAYDTALAWLMQKNYARFREDAAQFGDPLLAGQLHIEEGLVQSRAGDKDAARTLQIFLKDFPTHPRRAEARIAVAELAFEHDRAHGAESLIHTIADSEPTPEMSAQAEYLAIFLEDAKQPRDDEKVIALARAFITAHAQSPLLVEVRMKLGQVYFLRENFLNAQEQFENAARTEGTFAETALFLAGQCAMKLINAGAMNRALELFGKVAERKGPLEAHARLQQAIIKNKLGAEDDAVKIYDSLLGSPKPPEPQVHYAALIGKGDNLLALGKQDPKQVENALATYEQLLAQPLAGLAWRNQASYKKGKALQQLNRADEALAVFYDILDRSTTGPHETFWYAKAGFDAAGILEARQQWKNAIGVYEKMVKFTGPHSEQARQRVKTLRLEHFIWD